MPNQHKPNSPVGLLRDKICYYWYQGKNDKQILRHLLDRHIDTTQYGLGMTNFKAIRKSMDLLSTRQQGHTVMSIRGAVEEIRVFNTTAGILDMKSLLLKKKGIKVSRAVLQEYFETFEPELKQARLGRKLVFRQFWAAGVNVLWCIDQHDKWKYKFGLCFHVAVDPFSGYLIWLRVWWNNSNPILICSYYLDAVSSLGYVPLLTQSDPGSENVRVANAHSYIRQLLDPELQDGIQHNWKRDKSNIKAEIEWSKFRRRWTPGFELILAQGEQRGIFDKGHPLHILTFRFLVIPFIQREVDEYRERVNDYPKRKNKRKLTPAGRPSDIHFHPADFDSVDFKVSALTTPSYDIFLPSRYRLGFPPSTSSWQRRNTCLQTTQFCSSSHRHLQPWRREFTSIWACLSSRWLTFGTFLLSSWSRLRWPSKPASSPLKFFESGAMVW
ncbi:hypothetical protein FA13DRAFT_1632434 [Coprinellus micaceus]|uniref:Integrase core domain-containing protein n=1 Tax=Coprinellus micaceus TaxID=71717 RepID=A0A4Y7T6V1_COPMI|nr:hypothetical protein FA13DRAFT_1632434 [Coprinellus micaceus]